MMDRQELGAWLRLIETPGVGRESARRLLAAFGSPEAVFAESAAGRGAVIASAKALALGQPPALLPALLDTTMAWLQGATSAPRAVIALGDPLYPRALLDTADPPLLLYAQGRFDLLQAHSVAVVGSRNPTPQGSENALQFSRELSHAGLTIVSGMALGVDAAAHAGGLEGSGSTIAVVGTGMDRVYPKRNLELAHRIALDGLIVSEYPLGWPPLSENFPQRNRIIAGLARGTLVVEAALKSGSLITARMANEAGRDVFAIPGSIHSTLSRGCHLLIKQGAKLVETAADLLEELQPGASPAKAATVDSKMALEDEDALLTALAFDPVTLDALVARTGLGAPEVSVRLFELELEGRLRRLPGQLFQRVSGV
jgi:DNA processing protein